MEMYNVEEPKILESTDAIILITPKAICDSDQHLYHHDETALEKGDVLGHESMGIVEDIGTAVTKLNKIYLWSFPLTSVIGTTTFV